MYFTRSQAILFLRHSEIATLSVFRLACLHMKRKPCPIYWPSDAIKGVGWAAPLLQGLAPRPHEEKLLPVGGELGQLPQDPLCFFYLLVSAGTKM